MTAAATGPGEDRSDGDRPSDAREPRRAALSRAMCAMSKSGMLSANAGHENVVRIPAVVSRSLSEIGTPWNGASAAASVFARASARAASAQTVT